MASHRCPDPDRGYRRQHPGVEGIGPKTATKLLEQYGSVDGIFANLDSIKGKRRDNLEKARDFLPLARELVTLKDDLDMRLDLDDARAGKIDAPALTRIFKELGFRRHQADLARLIGSSPEPSATTVSRADVKRPPGPDTTAEPATLFDSALSQRPDTTAVAPDSESAGVAPTPQTISLVTAAPGCDYRTLTTAQQLDDLVATLDRQKIVAVDTETIGLGHRSALCGICLSWQPMAGVYIPVRSPDPTSHLDIQTVLAKLGPKLEDPELPKCGHNIKYDMMVLRHAGVVLRGVVFDSMVAAHLLGLPGRSMDDLALALLQHETIPISQLIGPRPRTKNSPKQKTMDQVPLDQITPYAAEDADITLRLYETLAPKLDEAGMKRLAQDVEMPLIDVLVDMEQAGIRVDPAVLGQQKAELAKRISQLKDDFAQHVGQDVNIDSPRQLADVMFNKMGLPVVKRTKTGPSTDSQVLEKLCDREDLTEDQAALPRLIIEYRTLAKLVNTYLDNLTESIDPADGRTHASFNQTGAATGRLSSSGPNLQNIPIRTDVGRQIRRAFVADPGPPAQRLISADYSQIELRILAHLSEDAALISAFETDQDIHTAVAAEVFGLDPGEVTAAQRNHAKMINFGIVYGITPFGLARRVDSLDVAGARELIDGYKQRFSGIESFLARCVQEAIEMGYVTTMLGRRREIRQMTSHNANTRSLGERLAINTVVQGSAADLIKLAMVNLHWRIERESLPMKLLLQIHDELVVEAPADQAEAMSQIVRDEMSTAMQLKVPLKVDLGIGEDWYSAK